MYMCSVTSIIDGRLLFGSISTTEFQLVYTLRFSKSYWKYSEAKHVQQKRVNRARMNFFKKVAESRCIGGFWDGKSRGKKIFIHFENLTPTGPTRKIGGFW